MNYLMFNLSLWREENILKLGEISIQMYMAEISSYHKTLNLMYSW